MTIDLLIACHDASETDIRQALTELLAGVLEDNQNEFDEDVVDGMIVLRHQRLSSDGSGTIKHTLIGFALELPEDTAASEIVITEFAHALLETPPIFHISKFEDPLLRKYLAERAVEIFAVEMKLRRVLSLIYLHAYQNEDPFNLLNQSQGETRIGVG